ncbi:MAG: hypothetical protein GX887_01070 [Firmicutes bacterium]|nr:hypothetical protein [Bacillota bacterium]
MIRICRKVKKQLASLLPKGALHIFLGNTITKFVAFFGSVFIVNILGKSEYGTLSYMENLFSYAYLLAGFLKKISTRRLNQNMPANPSWTLLRKRSING